ncbi:MAG: hypothetical protein LBV41_01005 [Cytophagaceae bacterium]|jgi:hypothetical protein|nr:hypothetical protein [Cytophagaceae bacterium]
MEEEELIEVKGKKQSRSIVPQKDVDVLTVSTSATDAWIKSELTLKWTSPLEFRDSTIQYKAAYDTGNTLLGERRIITQTFAAINSEIDNSLKYVKGYIADMFTKENAKAYYTQFGIEKAGNKYAIPRDNDTRQHSLEKMIKALDSNDMGTRKYGKTYWEALYHRFVNTKQAASTRDGETSVQVSNKAELKAKIIKTLNALISLVKANYPDNWKEELRMWGFQKEKY